MRHYFLDMTLVDPSAKYGLLNSCYYSVLDKLWIDKFPSDLFVPKS